MFTYVVSAAGAAVAIGADEAAGAAFCGGCC